MPTGTARHPLPFPPPPPTRMTPTPAMVADSSTACDECSNAPRRRSRRATRQPATLGRLGRRSGEPTHRPGAVRARLGVWETAAWLGAEFEALPQHPNL